MSPRSAPDPAGTPLEVGPPDLLEPVAEILDGRLSRHDAAPVLVAFSGGGDSLALLLAAEAWAGRAGRTLLAATVDHRLRPEGADWARACAARCRDMGVAHRTLVWEGERSSAGLQAAAREARHRLLAAAARSAGARVILMGHTADDVGEAAWMRDRGARTPSPREWSPSPVWPEGRDLFILRPLLRLRRAALRTCLAAHGERWIDDPANDDAASLRSRARRALAGGGERAPLPLETSPPAPPFREGPAGELLGSRDDLMGAGETAARRWLGAALVCAGGGGRAPRTRPLDLIMERLEAGAPFASCLAGARLGFDGARLVLAREARDRRTGSSADVRLEPGCPTVWDGRFEITVPEDGWSAGFVGGRSARLSRRDAAALRRAHSSARGAAPMLLDPDGNARLPAPGAGLGATARSLVGNRLAAACGSLQHESAIATWRNACAHPKSSREASEEAVDEPS